MTPRVPGAAYATLITPPPSCTFLMFIPGMQQKNFFLDPRTLSPLKGRDFWLEQPVDSQRVGFMWDTNSQWINLKRNNSKP